MIVWCSIALTLALIGGQPPSVSANTGSEKQNMMASVVDMLKLLPNLKPLEITACSYQKTTGTKKSLVPSPSDTLVQVTGWIEVKSEHFEKLVADEKWETLKPEQIPAALKKQLPGGELKTCKRLNAKFNSNPAMAHGMLIMAVESKVKKMWVLAQDIDHPLEVGTPNKR